MRNIHARAALVSLAILLGGCNSLLGIKLARSAPAKAMVDAAPVSEVDVRARATDAGRGELAAGRSGSAIESFQRALATGEPIAPAVNGLGVAYARLGRYDLAQRFFEQAMAANPGEPRYADNLARLLRSPGQAERRYGDIAAAVIKADGPSAAAVPAQTAQGRLQRVSRGEARITTVPPQAAPGGRAAVGTGKRFAPLIRISFADLDGPRRQSFTSVQRPESAPASAEKVTKASIVRR